jgi:hypothetical protein
MVDVTPKSRTLANGQANDAGPVEAQVVELYNNDQTLANAINELETHNYPSIFTNTISESTADHGVEIDDVLVKDGALNLPGSSGYTPDTPGDFGFDTDSGEYKGFRNGNEVIFQTSDHIAYPKGYLNGKSPTWASVASITIPTGLKARSSDDSANIEVTGSFNINLGISGTGGLDTGSESSNTWYYVYLIKRSSDGTVHGLFSTVNEAVSGAITLPSGYDLKRQLPLAVRNDASSNLLKFFSTGTIYRPYIGFNVGMSQVNTPFSGPSNIYQGTVGTSYTSPISGSAFVPTGISRVAKFRANYDPPGAGGYLSLRPTSESHEGEAARYTSGSSSTIYADLALNNSAQVEMKSSGGNASVALDVVGFFVTEMG